MSVQLQSENGMLGFVHFLRGRGRFQNLIMRASQTVTELPTTSFFSSADSFAMIEGGISTFQFSRLIQLANRHLATWHGRRKLKGRICPPRIMAKESADEKSWSWGVR